MTAPASSVPAAPLAPPADATLGRFVYHDLMATDPAAARAFYAALVGWDLATRDLGGFEYTDIRTNGQRFGGMVPLDPAHGLPSHWTSYVAVDDVAAACARAESAGGRVCVPPHEIPGGVGHFAVLNDPAGAMLSVVRFTDGRAPAADGTPGGAWWHELLSQDPDGASAFYAAVFGWAAEPSMALPDGQTYWMLTRGGENVGGMMRAPAEMGGMSVWQLYLLVDDVDAAVARAEQLGGRVTWPPMDVPNVGRMAGLADPSGGRFAVGAMPRG